eukprot:364798-Chlamydomonas_euryale.AAC.14
MSPLMPLQQRAVRGPFCAPSERCHGRLALGLPLTWQAPGAWQLPRCVAASQGRHGKHEAATQSLSIGIQPVAPQEGAAPDAGFCATVMPSECIRGNAARGIT